MDQDNETYLTSEIENSVQRWILKACGYSTFEETNSL